MAVERDLWHGRGYHILYESSEPIGPHYDIVGLDQVLGICPLSRLYRNLHGTIPEWAAADRDPAFPVGRADEGNVLGTATYVLNHLALMFSR